MDKKDKKNIKEFDGYAICPACSCMVMIKSGSLKKSLRRALALADHTLTMHQPKKAWRR